MNNNLLTVENLKKKYGENEALKGVSFSLQHGDFLSIFGPNGAGKSTLLKLLSAQSRATGGKIYYEGKEISELEDDFRSKFGVISHQPFLYENLSAYDNLRFYGRLYGVSNLPFRIKEILELVELYHRKDDLVRNFSRGMLQRLSIARALIHNPDIIFLDEPYTGLDQHASNILTKILKELFSNKKTIIMVTHNLSKGFSLSTKVAILKNGLIPFFKEKEEINEYEFEDIYISMVS
ncbi:MAG: ABC transporter ATP-binding protein [Calditerrivibrio sp.]|nr:ABC transporter ATP-binding protein [Calditerrivibrio sp.]